MHYLVQAVMPAGSVLLFTGGTLHAAGANSHDMAGNVAKRP